VPDDIGLFLKADLTPEMVSRWARLHEAAAVAFRSMQRALAEGDYKAFHDAVSQVAALSKFQDGGRGLSEVRA
jgi:hypothetical protein